MHNILKSVYKWIKKDIMIKIAVEVGNLIYLDPIQCINCRGLGNIRLANVIARVHILVCRRENITMVKIDRTNVGEFIHNGRIEVYWNRAFNHRVNTTK